LKGEIVMSDLKKYIKKRKKTDKEFAKDFDKGYQEFKIGEMLRLARIEAGLTQEDIAKKLNTKKSAISRIENHAKDIRLSTLENFANSVGKSLKVSIA
jgi:ribosome-binding protein aMBF1 (putative translation factor)